MAQTRLETQINSCVSTLLRGHEVEARDAKVIHDPILGTNVFSAEEVAVIDLPLVQRLRYISQTDVASLVYPACHHTRFDHSLGVAVIAGRFVDAINRDARTRQCSRDNDLIGAKDRLEIRMAALLHDVGHGPFSHLSEDRYSNSAAFIETKRKHRDLFTNAKPHEIMSYLMVTSDAFKEFFDREINSKSSVGVLDADRIGGMIIGRMKKNDVEGYLADIINGVFDADKLDYIQRDAYFSGLKMSVDLDRLLHSVWVPEKTKQLDRRLTVRTGAVSSLEQILFHKVQLYSTIYHHQKVRSAECLMSAIFDILADDPNATVNGKHVREAVDFLNVTDGDILFGHTSSVLLQQYVDNLKARRLYKRALVICSDTVQDPENSGLLLLFQLNKEPRRIVALRKLLVEKCGGLVTDLKDIWVDIPSSPSLREPPQQYICDPGGEPRRLEDFFHTRSWLKTFNQNKRRVHVFCAADEPTRAAVAACTAKMLEEDFGITLKQAAFDWAKNPRH